MNKKNIRRYVSGLTAGMLLFMSAACSQKTAEKKLSADPIAPLLEGMGDYHFAITTDDTLAQRFFDQGLVLAYGFNHAEAERSFREAARLDPECAMCYWGIALVLGPNINAPMNPENVPEAYAAVHKALALAPQVSTWEQAYIQALSVRYAKKPSEDRSSLDKAYAVAMRKMAHTYRNDLDAQVLFAEALMDTTPWDYWKENGEPKAVTREVLATLDFVLKRNPRHPGANHFYIHVVEDVHPERGLPMAERLESLVPGAGHLVHMPSHIYLGVGRYHDAVLINKRAVAVDEGYITQCRAQGFYPLLYYPHNIHVLWYAAMLGGEKEVAISAAQKIQSYLTDQWLEAQRLRPTLMFALVRFGEWQRALDLPEPPAEQLYARSMWHYGRGLALLGTGHVDEAAQEAKKLNRIAGSEAARKLEIPLFYGASQIDVASNLLQGELAGAQGHEEVMIRHLRKAVRLQEELPYMEPPYWFYPVRQSLGAALLRADLPAEAEQVYRTDLKNFPENGWSLYGLAQSLLAQDKTEAAAEVKQRFEKAWKYADVTLPFDS